MECKIKITTNQKDYKGKSIFDHAADELLIEESFSPLDEEGTMETSLFGTLEKSGDDYTLRYEEEAEGMGGTFTEVKFNEKEPEMVTIVRTGALDSFMLFEEGKRNVSVYNTGIMPFEICIYTKSVDNSLLDDGYLDITYLVEIKGASAQRTSLKMEIESL